MRYKRCLACDTEKPLGQFPMNRTRHGTQCRTCVNEARRARRAAQKDQAQSVTEALRIAQERAGR